MFWVLQWPIAECRLPNAVFSALALAGSSQLEAGSLVHDELVRRRLAQLGDPREVIADANARYSGARLTDRTLVPGNNARLSETRYETWLNQQAPQAKSHPAA